MLDSGIILETIHMGLVSFTLLEDMCAVGRVGLWGVFTEFVKVIGL